VSHRVEADDVGGAEHGRLGPSHRGSEQSVGFGDSDAVLGHPVEHRRYAERADPVGDEVRSVLAIHDALAEYSLAELCHTGEDVRIGLWGRDQFQKPHVANRIEEVRHHEMAFEILAAALRHRLYREAGCVGRDDAPFTTVFVDHLEDSLLDVHPFNDDFDDPVALTELVEIVLVVARGDQGTKVRPVEQRRFGALHCRDTGI